jgi:F-type H+-transporting ATPase subunit b
MLNIDISTIIFEIINFLTLTALLYLLLFKPILRGVNAREEEKRRTEEEIARRLEQAEELRSELDERLKNIEEQISRIIADAQDRMEEIRSSTLENAHQEAETILKTAAFEAGQLQNRVVSDHLEDLMNSVREVSRQVIAQTASPETHDHLVRELNERIWHLGSGEMDQVDTIRRSLDERFPTAYVETARELEPSQKRELMKTLSALVDQEVKLEVSHNPELICGLSVRVGDTLINNSVTAKLDAILDAASDDLMESLDNA